MRRGDRQGPSRGFTYVWVMAALAVLGVLLAAAGTWWAEDARREREEDLVRVGAAYARAIASYSANSPGSVQMAPRRLEDLVLDDRFPRPMRHLRRLYADPIEPQQGWGLITDGEGRIQGVHSRSTREPLRQVAFAVDGLMLPAATRYSDWKFIARENKP